MHIEKTSQIQAEYCGLENFKAWLKKHKLFKTYVATLVDYYGFDIMAIMKEAGKSSLPRDLFVPVLGTPISKNSDYKSWTDAVGAFEQDLYSLGYSGVTTTNKDAVKLIKLDKPVTNILWEARDILEWLQKQGIIVPFIRNCMSACGDKQFNLLYYLQGVIDAGGPRDVIDLSFFWNESPEGFEFWVDVEKKWQSFYDAYMQILKEEEK